MPTYKNIGEFHKREKVNIYRNLRIYYLKDILSQADIARLHKISRERVSQILEDMAEYSDIIDHFNSEDLKNSTTLYSICKRIFAEKQAKNK